MVNFIQYTFYQASVTSIAKFQFPENWNYFDFLLDMYRAYIHTLGLL